MPKNAIDRDNDLTKTAAEPETKVGADSTLGQSSTPTETPLPVGKLKGLGSPPPEPFPYALLLAYHRRRLRDSLAVAQIEAELNASPRWRAHLESIQFLDLERAAAGQDALDLQAFPIEAARQLCLYAAVSDGELFARAARTPNTLRPATRQEWAKHTKTCVYCRRMRRRAIARVEAERAELPGGEVLLREWLLEGSYADALSERTVEIVKAFRGKSVQQIVERLPPEQQELIVENKVKKVPLEDLARKRGCPVSTLETQLDEAFAKIPRLYAEGILAEIDQLFAPGTGS